MLSAIAVGLRQMARRPGHRANCEESATRRLTYSNKTVLFDDLVCSGEQRRRDRQLGFLNRKGWQSEVDKMINAYGAPIGVGAAKTIVDYLTANYGIGE